MSGILGSLSTAANALEVQRRGLDVAGQNIANANTVGYSRRSLQLQERAPLAPGEAGRGVEVRQVQAVRDLFVEARLRQEQQGLARETTLAESLSVIEAELGAPGESIDANLSDFFASFSALTEDPSSLVLRDATVREGARTADAFVRMSERLHSSRADADAGVRSAAEEVNRLASDIADLNRAIATNAGDRETLIDRRLMALRQLAEVVDITVTETDGRVAVSVGGGQALVTGTDAVPLMTVTQPVDGLARLVIGEVDVTDAVTGGRLGGHLEVRDRRLPDYLTRLDELAFTLATEVNAVHRAGTDANGDPGGNFFVEPVAVAGAAAALRIDPAVAADPRLLAAGLGGPLGNGTAQAIAGLRDARLAAGGTATLTDLWGQLSYRVGADVSAVRNTQRGREQVMSQLEQIRDSVSGVSIDEEAAALMRYQRAYEANARYFASVTEVLDILMAMVR